MLRLVIVMFVVSMGTAIAFAWQEMFLKAVRRREKRENRDTIQP